MRITRDTTSFQTRASISGRERFILLLMVVLFIGLCGSFLLWPVIQPVELEDFETPADPEVFTTVPGAKPIVMPPELEARIKEDTDYERVVREPEPFAYLVAETARRSYRFLASLGFERYDPQLLIERPKSYRCKTVEVKGKLLDVTAKPPPESAGPVKRLYQGTLELEEIAADGRPQVAFFELIDDAPDDLEIGHVYRLQGTFFKAYDFPITRNNDQTYRTGPLIVGKRMIRSYVIEAVDELDTSLLGQVDEDIHGEGIKELEFGPYYHVLSYVKNLPPDAAPPDDLAEKSWFDIWEHSEEYRGQWVRLIGTVKHLERQDLDDNPAGLDHVYRAIILNGEHRLFEVIFPSMPKGIAEDDWVTIDGVFFKNHAFENRRTDDQKFTKAPVVIGERISIREVDQTFWRNAQATFGIAALVVLVVFTLVLVNDRKRARDFVQSYDARRKRLRKDRNLNVEIRAGRTRRGERGATTQVSSNPPPPGIEAP